MDLTRKERLERLYRHEETDRPAVYSREGFPRNDPSYDRLKHLLREKSELKAAWNIGGMISETPVDVETTDLGGDFLLRVSTMHAPAGNLTEEKMIGKPGGRSQGHDMVRKNYIASVEDAEKYLSCEPPSLISNDFGSFRRIEDMVGDAGIAHVDLGSNPGGKVAELCGTELFAVWSAEERELLHELCRAEQQKLLKICRILIDNRIGPYYGLSGHELIAPPIHGLDDFRDFITRYDMPVMDLLKNAGGYVHVHCHGSIAGVLDEFIKLGVDVLHPFEARPMGDISAAEAKRRVGRSMTIEGNIQIADMYETSADNIRSQVRDLIRDAFYDNRGLIVSPSASPYVYDRGGVCFDMYEAMIDEVVSFSR